MDWAEISTERDGRPAPESGDSARFLQEYEQVYAELRADPEAWAEVQEERRAFDGTLGDGLNSSGDG